MKGFDPYKNKLRSKASNFGARNMLKRTYALGLLAAATLGCFLTPAAHASQVEVNKQTASQNAAAVGMLYRFKTKVATRTNWITQVQVITIPTCNTPKSLIKMPSKMAHVEQQYRFPRP